jgi:hypothetical protein
VTLPFYMFWICFVMIAQTHLLFLILLVGHSRTVKYLSANRIVVALGDRRPEWPKFVDVPGKEISYLNLGHTTRPVITGWDQIRYKRESSVEGAKEKLRYCLFYIKNVSAGLDLHVFLQSIKVTLWARDAK